MKSNSIFTAPLLVEWRDSKGTHYRLKSRSGRGMLLSFRVTWAGLRVQE